MKIGQRLLIIILFFVLHNAIVAQQSRLSSLFMFNKYDYIPAYAGLEGSLYLTGNYRSQWQNLDASPITQHINGHLPLYFLKGAAGMSITNHKQGPQRLTDVDFSYNYVYQAQWGLLSLGAKAGIYQYRLDGFVLRTPNGNYENNVIQHNDPRLSETEENSIGGTYGFSVYYINDFVEGGISIEQIPSYKTRLGDGSFRRATFINSFVEVPIKIYESYKLAPSMLIQSDLIQTQFEIATTLTYSGNIFGGLGVRGYSSRTFDSVLLIAGWKFNENYVLTYAFDVGVSSIRNVNQGTHEIQLNYNLNKRIGEGLSPKVIFNPRYM